MPNLPILLVATGLMSLTLLLSAADDPAPIDLSAYDVMDTSPGLGTQFSALAAILPVSACPECAAKTPPLEAPQWLYSDPEPGPPPVNATFLNMTIEFVLDGSVDPGKCKVQPTDTCRKMCEFDIAWRIINSSTQYLFLTTAFPAGDEADPDEYVSYQHVNSWNGQEHWCGEDTNHRITYAIFNKDGTELLFEFERTYEIGCHDCQPPPQDPI